MTCYARTVHIQNLMSSLRTHSWWLPKCLATRHSRGWMATGTVDLRRRQRRTCNDGDENEGHVVESCRSTINHIDVTNEDQTEGPQGYAIIYGPLIERPWPLARAVSDHTTTVSTSKRRKIAERAFKIGRTSSSVLVQRLQAAVSQAVEGACIELARRKEGFLSKAHLTDTAAQGTKVDLSSLLPHVCKDQESNDSKVVTLKIDDSNGNTLRPQEAAGTLITNPDRQRSALLTLASDNKKAATSSTTQFCVPARGGFLWTDLLSERGKTPIGWPALIRHARSQAPPSLVLLDPPWPNGSAKRQKRQSSAYGTVDDVYDLWRIREPVQSLLDLASPACPAVVACWVTNHAKMQSFALDKLFPAWDLELLGCIVWLKVTTNGELILPLDNKQGRKPYEILLLGRRRSSAPNISDLESVNVLTSVPTSHSRKPPIGQTLLSLLQQRRLASKTRPFNVYELFGRFVPSSCDSSSSNGSWIGIGNEPFTYNQLDVGLRRL